MTRKHAAISVVLVTCLAVLGGGAVYSLRHRPEFYEAALQPAGPPEVRREQAKRFVQRTLQLVDDIRYEDQWSEEFSEAAVNSWFAEELPDKYAAWLPPDVSSPRVKFEKDKLLLAFQTKRGAWSGVVSLALRAWVAGPNKLAIELQSVRAGLVPIPSEDLLERITADLRNSGHQLEWKHSDRGDVLVVTLSEDIWPMGKATVPVLEALDLQPGKLRVSGKRESADGKAASQLSRGEQAGTSEG